MRTVFIDKTLEETFEKDGYIVVDFLNTDEVKNLLNIYHTQQHSMGQPAFATTLMDRGNNDYRSNISKAIEVVFKDKVEALFDNHKWFFGSYLIKYPSPQTGYNGRVPLHQDASLVDETQYNGINIWCPLVDTNDENGTLQLIKGSQHVNQYPRGFGADFAYLEHENYLRQNYLISVPLKAGQAIIYTTKLFHASQPNTSNQPRLVASGVVAPAESTMRYYYFDFNAPKNLEVFEVDAHHYLSTPMFSRPDENKYKKVATLPISFDALDLDAINQKLAPAYAMAL